MNSIIVLTNNVVLIGKLEKDGDNITIAKPYSISKVNEGFSLVPFLEQHTGQIWNEFSTNISNVLSYAKAENNAILQGYLEKISGIEIQTPKIII